MEPAPSSSADVWASQLQSAMGLHQRGQLDQARLVYESILQANPRQADAVHLLGVIAYQIGRYDEAVGLIDRAIAITPNNAEFYINRAIALKQLKRLDAAIADFDTAVALDPNYPEVYYNRGNALTELKRLDAAVADYDQAIALKPEYATAHYNRANALTELKRFDAAVSGYDKAIALRADYTDAYLNRGNALIQLKKPDIAVADFDKALALKPDHADAYFKRANAFTELKRLDAAVADYDKALALKPDHADAYFNRGNVLAELKQLDAAVADYGRALALKPGHAEPHFNRGNTLTELKKPEAALLDFDRAITLKPDYAEAYNSRANALAELNRLDAAVADFDRAIALKPDYPEAYNNRANALTELRRLDAAAADYDQAIALKPDYADAHFNKALHLLLRGSYPDGLPLYEWRLKAAAGPTERKRDFDQPRWLGGEPLRGKTILLHSEQGLGDTIQFCRYAGLLAKAGASVVLQVQQPLAGLLTSLEGVREVIPEGADLPAFDCHCPLLSLPLAFETTLDTIPNGTPYLKAEPAKLALWSKRLGAGQKPRVGLAWSGNPSHDKDRSRSIALAEWAPHLPDGCEYISLQTDLRERDAAVLERTSIVHLGEGLADFADTAALCELMDLVVSVDTSVAHLSGALGKPTWILLPYAPDWRWLLDRDDSPWYPSVKLYRQDRDMTWDQVLRRVQDDLPAPGAKAAKPKTAAGKARAPRKSKGGRQPRAR